MIAGSPLICGCCGGAATTAGWASAGGGTTIGIGAASTGFASSAFGSADFFDFFAGCGGSEVLSTSSGLAVASTSTSPSSKGTSLASPFLLPMTILGSGLFSGSAATAGSSFSPFLPFTLASSAGVGGWVTAQAGSASGAPRLRRLPDSPSRSASSRSPSAWASTSPRFLSETLASSSASSAASCASREASSASASASASARSSSARSWAMYAASSSRCFLRSSCAAWKATAASRVFCHAITPNFSPITLLKRPTATPARTSQPSVATTSALAPMALMAMAAPQKPRFSCSTLPRWMPIQPPGGYSWPGCMPITRCARQAPESARMVSARPRAQWRRAGSGVASEAPMEKSGKGTRKAQMPTASKSAAASE